MKKKQSFSTTRAEILSTSQPMIPAYSAGYWTRKVVPEALEDRSSFAAELDTMRAKRELNEVIDKAVTAVVHPPEERHTEPILPVKETERKPNR